MLQYFQNSEVNYPCEYWVTGTESLETSVNPADFFEDVRLEWNLIRGVGESGGQKIKKSRRSWGKGEPGVQWWRKTPEGQVGTKQFYFFFLTGWLWLREQACDRVAGGPCKNFESWGSSRTARDQRTKCGGEGGTIGKEDPEVEVEEEETGKIEVLHSAIVAPGWAAKHCLGCSAGTRGLRQAMESVVVVYTMLTGAGFLCSSSVAGTALHSALEFVPPTTAPTPSAALGPGRPLFCPLFSLNCTGPWLFLLSSYQPG